MVHVAGAGDVGAGRGVLDDDVVAGWRASGSRRPIPAPSNSPHHPVDPCSKYSERSRTVSGEHRGGFLAQSREHGIIQHLAGNGSPRSLPERMHDRSLRAALIIFPNAEYLTGVMLPGC